MNDYRPVKNDIMTNNLKSLYIFTGDEVFVRDAYIKKIAEVSGKVLRYVGSVEDVIHTRSSSFLKQSYCYVCKDDLAFLGAEKAWGSIKSMLGSNSLILVYSKIDKRSKFYKQFGADITDFSHLDSRLLTKYIRRDLGLPDFECSLLIDACEGDYSKITLEEDKVRIYMQVTGKNSSASLHDLLNDGTIYQPPKDAIFDWCDAMLSGKPRKAFSLLNDCIAIGEPALRLLLVLYNNTKHLLQVQCCPGKDVGAITGLSYPEIMGVRDKVGVYSADELVNALRLIQSVEQGIKQGRIEESMAVPYVMVKMLY